jgi:hypothetical protein
MTSTRIARSAVLPAALLMAVSGSAVALASEPAAAGSLATQQYPNYTMRLNPADPHLVAGEPTTVRITFRAGHRLYGVPVELSTTGLPNGVIATFNPATPRIGERATMSLVTSVGFPKGRFTVSVTAITISSDPIGTTTPMVLTIQ